MNRFYDMRREGEVGCLSIYGEISGEQFFGDETTPKGFKEELEALGDVRELRISVNSGGGDVFAGQAIYNIIKQHAAHKTVYIEGLAASIASVIAMAGDEIVMPENALLMIHEAWSRCTGNKRDFAKMVKTLETIDGTIRGIYAARTGLSDEELSDMMSEETWMTAKDAKAKGFIDTVEENVRVAASFNEDTITMGGVTVAFSSYRNAESVITDTDCFPDDDAEELIEDHSNGADTQPVDDAIDDTVAARRRAVATLL